MKTDDLQPTSENIKETFLKNVIDRNSDVVRFCTMLDSIEGCYSIALDGKWGSGKTFFVKQAKMVLDAFNSFLCDPNKDAEQIKEIASNYRFDKNENFMLLPQVAVYYDAWANDNDEDPILSLIYAISEATDIKIEKKHDLLKIAGGIGDFFTGKKVSAFFEAIKGENPMEALKKQKSIHELMTDFINTLLIEHGNRLVIFIDELDRCKPSYAVQLLERIKHYFDDEHITFVFSVNTDQLQHTIKRHYGEGFDASRYLNRFFDWTMSLPPVNLEKYYQSIKIDPTYYFEKMCQIVRDTFHLEMRESSRYFHLTKIAAYKLTHGENFHYFQDKALQYALRTIIPVMIGLKISDGSAYYEFVEGRDCTPLINVFRRDMRDCFRIGMLLSNRETYDNTSVETGTVLVKAEDKIKEVYDALFVQDFNGDSRDHIIGELGFNAKIREEILRTAGLWSEFADYTL